MADCKEQAYSNDYYDFIVPYGLEVSLQNEGCIQRIDEDYDIVHYPRTGLPSLQIGNYTYTEIPKCYSLLDQTALEVSGILRLQNQPALALKGRGVLVGFIDTGIDYTNPIFRYSDGSTRIVSIWDQTIMDGTSPLGISYGAQYNREDINRALQSENPYDIVPSRDTNGHGTFLAGVACGGEDIENDFIGAVPEAEIAVVKLKEAKQYLKEFFFVEDGVPAYQENDIMLAAAYLNGLANIRNMPLVICLGLGTANGNRAGDSYMSMYLSDISNRRKRAVVVATGNEAGMRRHFQGQIRENMEYEDVEISVESDMEGFFVELWADAPELYAVSLISPTGEVIPRIPIRTDTTEEFDFVFEETAVTVDYRIEAKITANLLVFFRFTKPTKGLWIIRVYPENTVTGRYNMWLPLSRLTPGEVLFLRSNPEITLTIPSAAQQLISVGGYNAVNGSIFADSGRGYNITGDIKPDFVAPAVNVYGPGLRNNYVTYTGTSAAAAITTGAVAQIMQWAFVEQRYAIRSSAGIKNMLIRGAQKNDDRSYPNREWGYGTLEVYNSFEMLRV